MFRFMALFGSCDRLTYRFRSKLVTVTRNNAASRSYSPWTYVSLNLDGDPLEAISHWSARSRCARAGASRFASTKKRSVWLRDLRLLGPLLEPRRGGLIETMQLAKLNGRRRTALRFPIVIRTTRRCEGLVCAA